MKAKTPAQRKADHRANKTHQRARRWQTAICNKLNAATPAQRESLKFNANDSTPEELEAAAHNHRLLNDRWCQCRPSPADDEDNAPFNLAYFRSPDTGYHGWMCARCLCVVQTG